MLKIIGAQYEPEGRIHFEQKPVVVGENVALIECLGAGLLCNDSRLVREDAGRIAVQGDPTEAALIVAAQKAGLSENEWSRRMPRVEAIPFEAEYKYMATLHGAEEEPKVIYVTGAVETLVVKCDHLLTESGGIEALDKARVLRRADEMAARGLRVLAFARREMPNDHRGLEHEHLAGGLTFLGLQGKLDPPGPEAIRAVAKCRGAGIRVKMITGDHVLTARAIAAQIGLESVNGDLGHMREDCIGRRARNRSHFSNSTTANVKTPVATTETPGLSPRCLLKQVVRWLRLEKPTPLQSCDGLVRVGELALGETKALLTPAPACIRREVNHPTTLPSPFSFPSV